MIRALLLVLLAVPLRAAPAPYGILLLAHGGDAAWNAEVETLRARVDAKVPTETALGMADVASLQAAVDRLEKRGVARVVAVPLFVQTRSEVLDQTRYALGLSDKPSASLKAAYERMAAAHAGHSSHTGHGGSHPGGGAAAPGHGGGGAAAANHGHSMEFSTKQVTAREPIVMTPALDDSPLVGRILATRAKGLSKDPSRESIVLVAHGPVDDAAMPAWRESTAAHCAFFREGFRDCSFGLLRDDAAPEIRAAAVAELREKVARAKGGAIVLPVLIARGGIEKKIERDLKGLEYAWDGKTLMPYAGFTSWVLRRASDAAFDRSAR